MRRPKDLRPTGVAGFTLTEPLFDPTHVDLQGMQLRPQTEHIEEGCRDGIADGGLLTV